MKAHSFLLALRGVSASFASIWVIGTSGAPSFALERFTLESAPEPPPISPREPLAPVFSLEKAAAYLDAAALHWQREKKCGTCHTNFAYLMARPALSRLSPPAPEVRAFFENMVAERWAAQGPRWDAEVVCAATTLAWNDAATTRELHPLTRQALDRMCALQRDDGGWNWLKCGWPPMESDDHYGATFAALGLAVAPGGYAASDAGKKAIAGIRKYLQANPAPSLHHRAMVLWAATHLENLLSEEEKRRTLAELLARQGPDGGFSLGGLLQGWKEHRRQDDEPQETAASDGYATAFVLYVARAAGVPASDARLKSALRWLKTHQRQSGRWFTPSPTKDSKHYITHAGTAMAVMAIAACEDIPPPVPDAPGK